MVKTPSVDSACGSMAKPPTAGKKRACLDACSVGGFFVPGCPGRRSLNPDQSGCVRFVNRDVDAGRRCPSGGYVDGMRTVELNKTVVPDTGKGFLTCS
jgi:hypothetical protein